MGRRAKYFTLEGKREAHRKCVAGYKASPKGRAICNKNNRTAYAHRTTHYISSHISDHPFSLGLPEPLVTQYRQPLRATPRFKQAHAGHCLIALPDLGIWSDPYRPVSSGVFDGDHCLLDVLHSLNGWNLAQLEKMGVERYREAAEVETNVAMIESMRREIATRLVQWDTQYEAYQDFEGSELDGTVGDVALNWGARQVVSLEDELHTRARGVDVYLEAYRKKKLAWQCITVIE